MILCRFRPFDQAFAEGQSAKVNCQEMAKEHWDQRTGGANENSEHRERNRVQVKDSRQRRRRAIGKRQSRLLSL